MKNRKLKERLEHGDIGARRVNGGYWIERMFAKRVEDKGNVFALTAHTFCACVTETCSGEGGCGCGVEGGRGEGGALSSFHPLDSVATDVKMPLETAG